MWAKERDAVPVLIDLLGKVAPAQRGPIEDVLFSLAGNQPPTANAGPDQTVNENDVAWWEAKK